MSEQSDVDAADNNCQQPSPLSRDIFGESSASDISGDLINQDDDIGEEEDGDKEEDKEDKEDGEDGEEKADEENETSKEDDELLDKSTEAEGEGNSEEQIEKPFQAESEDDDEEEEEETEEGRTKKKRRLMIDDDEDDEEDKVEEGDGDKEDAEDVPTAKSIGLESDSEEEEGEGEGEEGEEAEEGRVKKKRRLIVADSEDEEENRDGEEDGDKEDKEKDDEEDLADKADKEDEEDKEDDEQLEKSTEAENAGEGDGEGEETGEPSKIKDPAIPDLSSDEESDDDGKRRSKVPDDFVYDFDLMMARKKEESYRSRKRKNIDIINDNDDIIADLITQMKQSAEEDFELNKNRKAATCKLRLLPVVETQLRKIDLRESFLDAGVLGVITDWLTPLPDRSLPNLQVRETMLKLLNEFNIMDVERLKASGIGKAVMYLYKHPKETKDNKKRAGVLISSWSRPIFSLDSDFHTMSKEEREQRDFDHMTKLSENKRGRTEPKTPPSSSRKTDPASEKTLRPGDKGWIPRARVPAPSTRDYVVRPKSNVDSEMSKSGSKKAITRLDKHLRNFREKKKLMKTQRAVPISIEGRRMTL